MSRNAVTGDRIATKLGSAEARRKFDENFDAIFRKPQPKASGEPQSDAKPRARRQRNNI